MHVTSQKTVAAPVEVVWDTLSDHAGISGWGPGITVTMDRTGTAEANGVGAIRRIATRGPAPDIVEEVVTYQPPNVLGYKALSGLPFPGYASEVRLTPAGGGTTIDWTISSTASLPLVKAPLLAISQVLLHLLARAAVKAHRG